MIFAQYQAGRRTADGAAGRDGRQQTTPTDGTPDGDGRRTACFGVFRGVFLSDAVPKCLLPVVKSMVFLTRIDFAYYIMEYA
ncbi:MAG: hypothetical protein IKO65_05715 [Victivallales bacterium]|nr:hypothetical protein [Victivallales bacterium]